MEPFVDEREGEPAVRGFLHRASRPPGGPRTGSGPDALLLTHGASGNCNGALLVALAEAFAQAGITTLRYDLPFRQARPSGPPSPAWAKRDQEGIVRAVGAIREKVKPRRVFAGGHSYGGRQTTMAAAADASLVDGLLLTSYPLHPPGRPAQVRTAHFPDLRVPALFVSGAKDAFGSIDELQRAIRLIPARTELVPVPGAGHSLLTKANKDGLAEAIVRKFVEFFGVVPGC